MIKKQGKYLIAIIILLAAIAGTAYLSYSKETSSCEIKLKDIPIRIGNWMGRDLPISERTYSILGTRDVLMREYADGEGGLIWLSIVHCANNRTAFHPPEICYEGGGLELLERGVKEIRIPEDDWGYVKANRLIYGNEREKDLVLYWFMAGNRIIPNYYWQQFYIVWDEIIKGSGRGALVHISAPVIDNIEIVEAKAEGFIGEAIPLISNYFD